MSETREIRTDYLARVEGEGAMLVRVRDGELEEVQFKIFEPPRFFEALLRGRKFTEAPDITARICGICPIAYMASSAAAMEQVCGVELPDQVQALRRLIYCGEWIESHVLHVAMLHAPDFLGYDGAIELARDRRDLVEIALRLKKLGNEVMRVDRRPRGAPGQLPRRRLLPRPHGVGAARARARARVGARRRARAGPLDGRVRLPRLRARLRVRVAAAAGRVSDRARPHRLQHRARHLGRRVRGALHRDATSSARTRCTRRSRASAPTSSARWPATRSTTRSSPTRPRRPPRRPGSGPCAATRSAPSSCARSRPCTRPTRRCGSSPRYERPEAARGRVRPAGGVGARLHRGAARDLLAPLPDRRRGDDPRREDRAADLPEPEDDRGGPRSAS